MATAIFTWTVRIEVREDFDPTNAQSVAQARHEAYQDVQESNGDLEDYDEEDDGELCPECGNYRLLPAMFTSAGKTLVEGKRCPDDGCAYNS